MLGKVSVPDGGYEDMMVPVPRHTEPFVSIKSGGLVKFSTGLINMLGNRRWIDDIFFYSPNIVHIIVDNEFGKDNLGERNADGDIIDPRKEINTGIWKYDSTKNKKVFKRERVGQVHLYKYIHNIPNFMPHDTPDGYSEEFTEHKFKGDNGGLILDRDNDPDGRVIIQLDIEKGQRNNNQRGSKGNGKKTTTKK